LSLLAFAAEVSTVMAAQGRGSPMPQGGVPSGFFIPGAARFVARTAKIAGAWSPLEQSLETVAYMARNR
jgi:hypothetical protein